MSALILQHSEGLRHFSVSCYGVKGSKKRQNSYSLNFCIVGRGSGRVGGKNLGAAVGRLNYERNEW